MHNESEDSLKSLTVSAAVHIHNVDQEYTLQVNGEANNKEEGCTSWSTHGIAQLALSTEQKIFSY